MSENWVWSDPRWSERTGSDPQATWREALRRSVDLRDRLAEVANEETSRAVFLVDTLNRLGQLNGYDSHDLWRMNDPS